MILGFVERFESLIPADAEWRIRARFAGLLVEPRGKSIPAVISFPIDTIDRETPAAWNALQVSRV